MKDRGKAFQTEGTVHAKALRQEGAQPFKELNKVHMCGAE